MRGSSIVLSVFLLVVFSAGCARERYGWEDGAGKERSPESAAPDAIEVLRARAQAHWALRSDATETARAIDCWEELTGSRAEDLDALVSLARAHYWFGEAHARSDEERLGCFDRGIVCGERALHALPEFREALAGGGSVEEAIEAVGKDGIGAIYWSSVNLGKWAKLKGFAKILVYKERVKRRIERVLALDPTWFHGAAHRYFGAFYAIAPAVAGGDLDKSREHFQASLRIAPGYLGTKVLMAEHYCPRVDDLELFERLLREVLAAPEDTQSEIAPEQALARRQAAQLLAETDDLF